MSDKYAFIVARRGARDAARHDPPATGSGRDCGACDPQSDPGVRLIDEDGNAFAILATVRTALRNAGYRDDTAANPHIIAIPPKPPIISRYKSPLHILTWMLKFRLGCTMPGCVA